MGLRAHFCQAAVKASLTNCVGREQDKSTRKKMADTTGEVASMVMEDDTEQWPEMFPFLFASAKVCPQLRFCMLGRFGVFICYRVAGAWLFLRVLETSLRCLSVVCTYWQSSDPGLRESAHIIMQRLAFSVARKLTQDLPSVYKLCEDGMTVSRPAQFACTHHFDSKH